MNRGMHLSLSVGSLVLASLLGGCGKSSEETPPSSSTSGNQGGAAREQYTIGVIAKSQSNPVFQAARTGAEEAARDLSEAHGIDVEVEWRTPNTEDAQLQAQYLEQLASQGADGIAVSCSDAALLTGTINDAYERHGVEVVCFDSDAPESARFAYYGIDDVEAGRAVMRRLAEAMDGSGLVAILAGNQNAPNLQARVRGVKEEMANYPEIRLDQVYYHPETAPDAASMVQQVQASKPEIGGWAMVGGWPLFTENALDGVHERAKVVSVDHLPPQLEYVRDGQVQALIGQDCYGWGYRSVELLIDKLHFGKDPESVVSHFELQVVTQENVDEFEGIWDKWVPNR